MRPLPFFRRSGSAIALWALVGCSSHPATPPTAPDQLYASCSEADGGTQVATEDNFVAFVDAESAQRVVADLCRSPELTEPDPAVALDPNAPPTFVFNPVHAVCTLPRARPRNRGGPRWTELFLGSAEAAGTCPPLTGENYWLKLIHFGEPATVYSALLSVTSFTPDPAIWKAALAGRQGQTLNLSIERGGFTTGALTDGPFTQPQPWVFQVTP